jgi:hypothetical protein
MDITDRILSQLDADNQSDRLSLADLVSEFQSDVLWLDSSNMNEVESELMTSQYAYIKFGLVLEKVRNQCMWKKCIQKFSDFRQFCQKIVNLNIWQVSNAIKSAQVAIRLCSLGFNDLPRNASQALKLADLSIERLGEVWANVLATCQGHKITAAAIESQIHPDKQPISGSVNLPTALLEKLQQQAIEHGVTLTEYLEELVDDRIAEDNKVEPVECDIDEIIGDLLHEDRELVKVVDRQPSKSILTMGDEVIDRMDAFFNSMLRPRPA